MKLTFPPDMLHTLTLAAAIVKLTGRNEVVVAFGVYLGPPKVAVVGAFEVK